MSPPPNPLHSWRPTVVTKQSNISHWCQLNCKYRGHKIFLMSKVLCTLFCNLHSSLFSPSLAWSANWKTKYIFSHQKYLRPCNSITMIQKSNIFPTKSLCHYTKTLAKLHKTVGPTSIFCWSVRRVSHSQSPPFLTDHCGHKTEHCFTIMSVK